MRKNHAREIRKGILVARDYARGHKEDNLELTLSSMWRLPRLSRIAQKAFDRSWRKKWRRLK